MKKIILIVLAFLFVLSFSSCSRKSTITAEEYISQYYENLNQGNYSACYNQLNKNSAEQIKTKYELNAEDYIRARSLILGPVVNYEITSSRHLRSGKDKIVAFDVNVDYQRATLNESIQVMIKEDGQLSINSLSLQQDDVALSLVTNFIESLKTTTFNDILSTISSVYFEKYTERNLESMINQASVIGGPIKDYTVLESNYIYEPQDNGSYVYECLVEMNYENMVMSNRVKIAEENGELGIGYTMILPEKVYAFFNQYTDSLKNQDKNNMMNLYQDSFFGGNEDKKDTKWRRLLSYSEAYGELIGYDIQSIGVDSITDFSGTDLEVLRADVFLNYKNQSVKHELVLTDAGEGYVIYDEYISSE